MKVLVVDDSRSDRKMIRYNLEWHGCQVIEASNGKQGLEVALREKPNLITSDCLMPIMDGFQFLHEVMKQNELRQVPFIFYSAVYTGSKEAELAMALGARAFIEKPKNPEELWEEIGRVMAAHSSGGKGGSAPALGEEEFLRNYSQMVAGKLEEKVRELTELNESLLRLNGDLERRVVDRTAQLEAVNQELEAFAFAISHDLRAPLRHQEGFAQVLLEEYGDRFDCTAREYLGRIRGASGRMLEMIEALLELSRFARGKVSRETVNLSKLVQEIVDGLRHDQPERRVRCEIAEGVVVRGDARLLRVVLENLVGNAWKFTAPRSEGVIEFYSCQLDGRPAFTVRDNGVGFDMAYAERLFTPFQRMHKQEEFPGRGIGLALVRRIVNRHGGKVVADAKPDGGACFTFSV